MENKGMKNLTKNQFSQILQLKVNSSFLTPATDQTFAMLNEMGYTPLIKLIHEFKKSKLHFLWSYFFGIILKCFTGHNFGLDKAKG